MIYDDERIYHVYAHINKINGKIYIGITKRKPEQRWGKDGHAYQRQLRFYRAIQKYGWDNFEHEIIANNLTKKRSRIF